MNVLERVELCGIVPVVVIENADDAVDTAKALLRGGIDVMEVTFRTAAAADSIKAVSSNVPEMLVGAGTVITLDQAKEAVRCGANFIVSPGYNDDVVAWCIENGIPVMPGCVTPTEIMAALKRGLKILKFFPANVYGGISALKSLAGPFGSVKFIPTGGINMDNLKDYISSPYVHAVGGSWLCSKNDISAHNYDKITDLCKKSRDIVLGYELAHIGINSEDENACQNASDELSGLFGFGIKAGNSSNFVSNDIEVLKSVYLGTHGHIAISTNRIESAVADLTAKGYKVDESTKKYKGDRLKTVYLENEIGGFAIHLVQK